MWLWIKIKQRLYRKRYRLTLTYEYRFKKSQNFDRFNNEFLKSILYPDQIGFIPEMQALFFTKQNKKTTEIIHLINYGRNSVWSFQQIQKKTFNKFQYLFVVGTSSKLEGEEKFLYLTKGSKL